MGSIRCVCAPQAVGLPMEDALVFWRTAMAPQVPHDKFEKEYAYNIRHNYGARPPPPALITAPGPAPRR